jgi:hypothetical protein
VMNSRRFTGFPRRQSIAEYSRARPGIVVKVATHVKAGRERAFGSRAFKAEMRKVEARIADLRHCIVEDW